MQNAHFDGRIYGDYAKKLKGPKKIRDFYHDFKKFVVFSAVLHYNLYDTIFAESAKIDKETETNS